MSDRADRLRDIVVANWSSVILPEIGRRSIPLQSLMQHVDPTATQDGVVVLTFPRSHQFALTTADSPPNREVLEAVLTQVSGADIRVSLVANPEPQDEPAKRRPHRRKREPDQMSKASPWPPLPPHMCNKIAEDLKHAEHIEAQAAVLERELRVLHHIIEHSTMPYKDYLKTDFWKEQRQKALDAAQSRCQACNSTSNLDVHHRTYKHRGFEPTSDLTVLCRDCHDLFHKNGRLA